ncbi:hypothetical protein XFF4834R_chr40690 [Xanthomonas citri pv. fuscans]|nr:hypothetical protein XFF4834R_chr40690 [Xanthomonas citri pv. fuscans]
MRIQRASTRPHAAEKYRISNAPFPSPAGRRCPEGADEGTATRIAHLSTSARRTTGNAQRNQPQCRADAPFAAYRRTLQSTADIAHRVRRTLPIASIRCKGPHPRLRNISWLLLANRRHRRIFGQDRINHFFYRNTENGDESSRLVRITNRLNANFSSWSHQMQTDPTIV